MFKLGEECRTYGGDIVKIVEMNNTPHYECVKGSDGKWRYNRRGDYGRLTGWSGQNSNMAKRAFGGEIDLTLNPDNLIY